MVPNSLRLPCLLLFALLFTSKRLCAQTAAEIAWLNTRISPIHHTKAGNGFTDLKPIANVVRAAKIVGLGECTHGSHEVFEMKHRLLEYLVTEQGFTTFAIEADYGYGQILNEYVQTGKGDSLTVHNSAGFSVWNTKEFWEMVEWMRAYNQRNTVKLQYVGIDIQSPFPNLLALNQYARQQADTTLRRHVLALRDQHFALKQTGDNLTAATKQLLLRLSVAVEQRAEAIAAPSSVRHNAHVLVQFAQLLQQGPNGTARDQAMADNVALIIKQNPATKVVVWAHNEHIRKADKVEKRMGYYLDKQFGAAYAAIGFATGQGTASTVTADGSFVTTALQPPVPDSFEQWFARAHEPNFLLNLQAIKPASTESNWLSQAKYFRLIGARVVSKKTTSQFNWHQPLPKLFDAVIYFHQTSQSQAFSPR